jgi:hypothetical protein
MNKQQTAVKNLFEKLITLICENTDLTPKEIREAINTRDLVRLDKETLDSACRPIYHDKTAKDLMTGGVMIRDNQRKHRAVQTRATTTKVDKATRLRDK